MDMGMPVQEVPVTLDAGHRPRHGSPGVGCDLKEVLERFIRGAGELGQSPASPEVGPEPPGEGEDHMPMGHRLEDLPGDELAELDLALLVAGRTEAPPLAGEGQQILVATLRATDPSEAPVQDTALPEGLNGMLNACAQGPVGRGEAVVIHPEEFFEVLLNDLPERRVPWPAALINLLRPGGDGTGHRLGDRFDRHRRHCRTLPPGWGVGIALIVPATGRFAEVRLDDLHQGMFVGSFVQEEVMDREYRVPSLTTR